MNNRKAVPGRLLCEPLRHPIIADRLSKQSPERWIEIEEARLHNLNDLTDFAHRIRHAEPVYCDLRLAKNRRKADPATGSWGDETQPTGGLLWTFVVLQGRGAATKEGSGR